MPNEPSHIIIKGAREHNLKGIDLRIPKNQLVVLTGLSGSGKSSLAFDTLYAEGQRRYVESLSSYARQFLGLMKKPEVESIEVLEEKEEKLATETDFEQMLVEFNYEDGDELYDQTEEQRSRKKGKNKRRQLVFDEDMGEVVSKRRRKGSRKRNEWDDF